MANIGYARVSTVDQNMALQLEALRQAGVEKVFRDQGVSGSLAERPGLDRCLEHLRAGDILVVWKLDRLGRSTRHVLAVIDTCLEAQAGAVRQGVKLGNDIEAGPLAQAEHIDCGEIAQHVQLQAGVISQVSADLSPLSWDHMNRRLVAEAHGIDHGIREVDAQHAERWVSLDIVGIPHLARPVVEQGILHAFDITHWRRRDGGIWRLRFCLPAKS